MMQADHELAVLRALGLKGRADAAVLADVTGLPRDGVEAVLDAALDAERVKDARGALRLTPAGRQHLAALLEQERSSIDVGALEPLYERFHAPNTHLKELMTAWQMRDGAPNDHADRAYDDGVAGRVIDLHRDVEGLVDDIAAAAPRLGPYPRRLGRAARHIAAGEHDFVARPLTESFHTVWFELHEELIALLGRDREDEARAGRAE